MAQFFEDWSGQGLDSVNGLTGWSRRYYTAHLTYTTRADSSGYAPAGRALEVVSSGSIRAGCTYSAADGSPEKCEVAALISTNIPTATSTLCGPMGRASGGSTTVTTVTGLMTGHPGIRINQYNGGTVSSGTTNSSYSWAANTPYWVVLRLDGTTATQELRSADDPNILLNTESWTVSVIQSGWLGMFFFQGDMTARVLCWCAGTDGDPAPIPGLTSERQRSRLILTPW